MKPAPFEYVAVADWPEAFRELQVDGAQILAGGQTLIPLMNQRLVRPKRLVDISGIHGVIQRREGVLRIDATVRQAALERSTLVAAGWPLLAQAVRHVGHPATRSRGTVGGSVVHADPRAELPCAFAALDARPIVAGPRDVLIAIEVPPLPDGAKTAFAEYARTSGDFADAGVAVVLAPGHAAIAVLGAGRATAAETALREGAADDAVAELAAGVVEGDHRRALVAELTRRALTEING